MRRTKQICQLLFCYALLTAIFAAFGARSLQSYSNIGSFVGLVALVMAIRRIDRTGEEAIDQIAEHQRQGLLPPGEQGIGSEPIRRSLPWKALLASAMIWFVLMQVTYHAVKA